MYKKIQFYLLIIGSFFCAFAESKNPYKEKTKAAVAFSYLPADNFDLKQTSFKFSAKIGEKFSYKWFNSFNFSYQNVSNSYYFPSELYNVNISIRGEKNNNWLIFSVNSNSDKPFSNVETVNFTFNSGWEMLSIGNNSFIFGVFYRSLNDFAGGFPIPFIYYQYKSENVYLLFPFIFRYKINKKNSIMVSYFPVRNFKVSYTYRPIFPLAIKFLGQLKLYRYYLADRINKDEFLFYERKTVGIEASMFLNKHFQVKGFLGYSFNGKYYKGEEYDQFLNLRKIDNSVFLTIRGSYYF